MLWNGTSVSICRKRPTSACPHMPGAQFFLHDFAGFNMYVYVYCNVFISPYLRPLTLVFLFARVHLLHVPRVGNVLQCRACKMKLVGTHSCMGAHRLVSKSAKLWLTYVVRKTCMVHVQTRRVRSVTCSMSRSRRMCLTLMTTISADRHYKC